MYLKKSVRLEEVVVPAERQARSRAPEEKKTPRQATEDQILSTLPSRHGERQVVRIDRDTVWVAQCGPGVEGFYACVFDRYANCSPSLDDLCFLMDGLLPAIHEEQRLTTTWGAVQRPSRFTFETDMLVLRGIPGERDSAVYADGSFWHRTRLGITHSGGKELVCNYFGRGHVDTIGNYHWEKRWPHNREELERVFKHRVEI